jgi:hypothetical protein
MEPVLVWLRCRWPDLQAGVLMAPDCVMVLSERLQMFRDTEVSHSGALLRQSLYSVTGFLHVLALTLSLRTCVGCMAGQLFDSFSEAHTMHHRG